MPVIVRTAAQWSEVVGRQPFPDADRGHLHVSFLPVDPPADALEAVDLAAFAPEAVVQIGRELHLHLAGGVGRSKLTVALGRVPVLRDGTVRNWRTISALHALVT